MKRPKFDGLKERIEKSDEAGGHWVKLKENGAKVVGVFVGDPRSREVHWAGTRYEQCAGVGCTLCKAARPNLRIVINLAVRSERGWEMKALEQSAGFFKDVLKCDGKYGLDSWCFEIERHGAAGDTKTTYSLLPEEKLSKEDQAAIEALPLLDLENLYSEKSESAPKEKTSASVDEYDAEESVPAKVADAIVTVLKANSPEVTAKFLEKFAIKRVRDLKLTDKKAALAFLDTLDTKSEGASSDDVYA